MRYSIFPLVIFSVIAFSGVVLAADTTVSTPEPVQVTTPVAPAPQVVNPMGAGLIVPIGEAASPITQEIAVPVYVKPDITSDLVGVLQSVGSTIPYQTHVIVKRGPDPDWKPNFYRRLLGRTAPIIDHQTAASEFALSLKQKGIMVVSVQGSWLQLAQGYMLWTRAVADHAQFIPWSELYQQASFPTFQLSAARAGRADLVPLGEVTLRTNSAEEIQVKSPARFVLLPASSTQPGVLSVRLTGSSCKHTPIPLGAEGKEGTLPLFAANGAPQVIVQPEVCPEDKIKK